MATVAAPTALSPLGAREGVLRPTCHQARTERVPALEAKVSDKGACWHTQLRSGLQGVPGGGGGGLEGCKIATTARQRAGPHLSKAWRPGNPAMKWREARAGDLEGCPRGRWRRRDSHQVSCVAALSRLARACA
eukprot:14936822-Alexandrium_andersonii.AAC.1